MRFMLSKKIKAEPGTVERSMAPAPKDDPFTVTDDESDTVFEPEPETATAVSLTAIRTSLARYLSVAGTSRAIVFLV